MADGSSCGPGKGAGQPGGVSGPVQHLLHLPDPAPADRTVGSERADGGGIQKKPRKSEREMTTPLFLLRCVQLGISIADLDLLTIGLVNDMFTERQNDEYVPYFYIIKTTPVQPLSTAVAKALIPTILQYSLEV